MGAGKKVKCKHCGDVIVSKHVHDFVWCKCRKIAVDGGDEYLRLIFPDSGPYTDSKPEDHFEILETDEQT